MKKIYFKLIVMLATLLMSVSVVIMSSYAWLVLSGSPVVSGIQVAIGGGNTILTAPDVTITDKNGNIFHYPGHFSDKLNFGQNQSYAYLQELGNLTPVSTSNGIDWFIPTYYNGNDPEVQSGKIASGTIRDVSEFLQDSELSFANLNPEKKEDLSRIGRGSYIYLDFWVVSPGGDYELRVSTGEGTEDGGSFVVDLMEPQRYGDGSTLVQSVGSAAPVVRVGFLANDTQLVNDTMLHYKDSYFFDSRFTSLRGIYREPGTGTAYLSNEIFTIYEPNGDYHPENKEKNGSYVITRPLGLTDGIITEQNIGKNLTVQRKSTWAAADNGNGTAIEQQFQTAMRSWTGKSLTVEEQSDRFYSSNLQGQISPYVNKGSFISRTDNLYAYAARGSVSAEELDTMNAGATDDVSIIQLQRNVPQRIRMFIWLEGQDMDCVDSVNSARFAVNIELAGGSLE